MNFRKEYFRILLAYLAIAFSGVHFFGTPVPQLLFLIISIFFIHIKYYYQSKFFFLILISLYVSISQYAVFNAFSVYEFGSILIGTIIVSYLIFLYLQLDFPKYYVKALFFISLISLGFYFLSLVSASFLGFIRQIPYKYEFLDTSIRNNQFILHSVSHATEFGILRHNGVFHEPGVFSLFLIIGLYFNIIVYKKLLNSYGIIFIISIVSTFSTAGFISLLLLVFGYYSRGKTEIIIKILMLLSFVVFSMYLFFSLDFMAKKVEYEFTRDMNKNMTQQTAGRIYGLRKSIYVLKKYPLTGRGLLPVTRTKNPFSPEALRYGLAHEIAKMGFVVALLYLYYLIKGIRNYCTLYNESLHFAPFVHDFMNYVDLAVWGTVEGEKIHHRS